ncbi:serine/threonine-protein kinase TBK1 [Tetranychus urticae]|uniref:Protein kinase domain-containing protein n=1 Tax=Tetranychus urticae TaxID=32264 RepID=T1KY61_TETUR|nr:serine/threonine-protein kinase TBK1 [Tetranychus urticae]
MAYLRSSRNYVWNVNNVLGKGATGAVYCGVNKYTGDPVAVKSFNHASHMRPYEVQEREFEVLKKVNHQNIVRLISIEEESDTHHKVLIMELCTGGSLFNILDDPINCYGLEEKEFTAVLKHLAAGMKHLRDNHIIHRDLKPGNIMKFIGEDGISIYKLTDFGAARVLEDDQPFMSLYGTEEYLHPDMYARAVLHKSAGKSFRANVDLWSIGVTLYHIATGSLPFKPYGGRKNKETMFKITTEKASGIISGCQHTDNGEIVWSRNLPQTCLLSPALQALIVPLLAGIMECDSHKMWSFDKFFTTVTYVLSHKVVYIFYINHMEDVVIYLHPSEGLNDLKHHLENKVSIPAKSALLLWNKQQIHDLAEVYCTPDNPVLLLNSDVTKLKQSPLLSKSLSKFPIMHTTVTNFEEDAQKSKICSSIAYAYSRTIEKCVLYYQLANITPMHVISLIDSNFRLLTEKQQACSHFYNSLTHQLNYFSDVDDYLEHIVQLLDLGDSVSSNFESMVRAQILFESATEYSTTLMPKMTCMKENIKKLQEDWHKMVKSNTEIEIETSKSRAKYYCQKIRESWQFLHKDKAARVLSVAEDQLHQLEKVKIDNNSKKLKLLMEDICFNALSEITKRLESWYTGAQVALKQSELLFKEFSLFTNKCEELQQCFNKVRDDQKGLWQMTFKKIEPKMKVTTDNLTDKLLNDGANGCNRPVPHDLVKFFREYEEKRERFFSLVEENRNLVNEFESISLRDNPQ